MSQLDELKKMTTVVVDTGDIESIKKFLPTDGTTNPSLILAAMQKPEYKHILDEAFEYSKKAKTSAAQLDLLMDMLCVLVGIEILKIIPGRVSTEVPSHLSFDVQGSINKGKELIALYEEKGINRERILIKLASTWEGGLAAKDLEKQGIHCNMTLMFSLAQAVHCANAKATLISPFVGRILDWYKKAEGVEGYAPAEDPGVRSVSSIYKYYKKFGIKTQIMGASFRNKEEILELAGCDLLTISPHLLAELSQSNDKFERKLSPTSSKDLDISEISLDEKTFRWMLNQDAMATEKLSEGIRNFAKDTQKLEDLIGKAYKLN